VKRKAGVYISEERYRLWFNLVVNYKFVQNTFTKSNHGIMSTIKYIIWFKKKSILLIKFSFYRPSGFGEEDLNVKKCIYIHIIIVWINYLAFPMMSVVIIWFIYFICFIRLMMRINWENKREVKSMTILRYTIVLIIYLNL
jgi:hypothetical protein